MRVSKTNFIAALFFLFLVFTAAAQSTVYIVRHAQKAKDVKGDDNPPLTEAGQKRAQDLAKLLQNKDIKRIYVSEFTRSQQTAAPIVKALNIRPTVVAKDKTADLNSRVKSGTGNALVVGHSDTIPDIIAGLAPGTIAKDELKNLLTKYDNLFVVTLGNPPSLSRETYPTQSKPTPAP
jgi:phosphohistidine phosphatase SixA